MTIYLYTKTHSITGLKYFGKTVRNPYTYNGSGLYWKRHIRKYGTEHIITENVWEFECQEKATNFALRFSMENNIVESAEWANMKNEDALAGWGIGNKHNVGRTLTEDHRRKISKSHMGLKYLRGRAQSELHVLARVKSRSDNGWFADPTATGEKIQQALGTPMVVELDTGEVRVFPSKISIANYLNVSTTTALNLCNGKTSPHRYGITRIYTG